MRRCIRRHKGCSCGRQDSNGLGFRRRLVQRRADVLCDLLDATKLAAARMGTAGRRIAGAAVGVFSYWDDSYSGGALAATAGALVLGALPRIMRHQRARDALLIAFGLAVLANTRPYEGLLLSLPVALTLLVWSIAKNAPPWLLIAQRLVMPTLLVLIPTGTAMGIYFQHVTDSPFHMPYQVNRATYVIAPYFLWLSANPKPVYRHAVMRDF